MAGPVTPATPQVPQLINAARWLFIASALLGMVRFVAELFDREMLVAETRRQNPALSQDEIDAGVNGGIVVGLIIALVIVVAYTRLSNAMARGRNWARIALTVLGAASVVFGLFRLIAWASGVAAEVGVVLRPADIVITCVTMVLDTVAIVFMFRMSAHFRKRVTVDTEFLRS